MTLVTDIIPISSASEWIAELAKKYRTFYHDHKQQIDMISDIFGDAELLAKTYIEPHCQHNNPADVDEDLPIRITKPVWEVLHGFLNSERFAQRDGSNQLFVLADAGMGKTSLLVMMALTHIQGFWPEKHNVVLAKLGRDSLEKITQIPEKRDTHLLLDALDEDPLSWGKIEERLKDILHITQNFRRVIITCRTQFFPATDKDPFERRGRIVIHHFTCPMFYLSPFDDQLVDEYLRKRFPNNEQEATIKEAKRIVAKMDSLRFRPMLLSYIEYLLDSDIKEPDEYFVYNALLESWLDRECRKMQGLGCYAPDLKNTLWNACISVALRMERTNSSYISPTELDDLLRQHPEVSNIKYMDVGGRSLLNRNSSGHFRFAHYSIREFLMVRAILIYGTEINQDRHIRLTQLQTTFLLCFIKSFWEKDRRQVKTTKLPFDQNSLSDADLDYTSFSGSSFLNCNLKRASLKRADLRNTDFTEADLVYANLMEADLAFAILIKSNLTNATIEGANFAQADLTGALLQGVNGARVRMPRAKLLNADLTEGSFYKADFTGAFLDEAILEKANLDSAQFIEANMNGAKLIQTDLTNADLTNSNMNGAKLIQTDLTNANLTNSNMKSTTFNTVNLEGAILKGANFQHADLRGTDLSRALVKDADFSKAHLSHHQIELLKEQGAIVPGMQKE